MKLIFSIFRIRDLCKSILLVDFTNQSRRVDDGVWADRIRDYVIKLLYTPYIRDYEIEMSTQRCSYTHNKYQHVDLTSTMGESINFFSKPHEKPSPYYSHKKSEYQRRQVNTAFAKIRLFRLSSSKARGLGHDQTTGLSRRTR